MFDFPNTPTVGQQVIEPNGSVVQWDGTKWASVASQPASLSSTLNNVGRNLLHNGLFNIQQRGAGPWTTTGAYTADRWSQFVAGSDTCSTRIVGVNDANRAQIGDESATSMLNLTVTGSATAGSFSQLQHRIENVLRLSGKTVILSFWAITSSPPLVISALLGQNFGTGGSPSPTVYVPAQRITTTGTFARYSMVFTLPSAAGKTFGTNVGTDYTTLVFYFSDSSTVNIPIQSGQFWLWGIQLEIGATATQLEKIDSQDDLKHCQRFYCSSSGTLGGWAGSTTSGLYWQILFPARMRSIPTITFTPSSGGNWSAVPVTAAVIDGFNISPTITAAGSWVNFNYGYTASADL